MSLNIKNPRVHELAREAAARTGRTQTSVIEMALEQLLEAMQVSDPAREVDALLDALDARLTAESKALLDAHDLYDEAGLPA